MFLLPLLKDFLREYFPEGRIESMQKEYGSIITDDTEKLQQQYDSYAFQYNNTFKEKQKNTLVKLFSEQVKKVPMNTKSSLFKRNLIVKNNLWRLTNLKLSFT